MSDTGEEGMEGAPAGPLERLLVVQRHDTEADQLRHRLNALPERARLDAKLAEIAALEAQVADLSERRGAISRDLKRLEDEVAVVEARRAETDAKLYGGVVNAARELQALQDELASLKRRQTSLEDDELELMEAAEPLDADLERLGAEQAAADEEATALTAALAEAETSVRPISSERSPPARRVSQASMTPCSPSTPDCAASSAGSPWPRWWARRAAAATSRSRRSRSTTSARRPAGAMVHCEECGRILVH